MHTLEQLMAFSAVYKHKSYSGAGRALRKDRTTVRDLVKAYEDVLGMELFTIQGRKAIPTKYAINLIEQAHLVIRQNEKLVHLSQAMFEHKIVELNIGYDEDFPAKILSLVEQNMLKAYPELKINWLHRNRKHGLDQIVSGEIDFVVMSAKGKIDPEQPVVFKHLGFLSYGLYVGAKTELAAKSQLSLEDLQLEIQYIGETTFKGGGLIKAFSSRTRIIGSNTLIVEMLRNQGWALLPRIQMEEFVENNILVKMKSSLLVNDVKVPFSAFHRIGMESQPLIMDLMNWFEQLSLERLDS